MSIQFEDIQITRFDHTFHHRLFQKPGSSLVVFFSSLRPDSATYPNFFNRINWVSELDVSCLFVAAPGLSVAKGLRGCWYQGGKGFFSIRHIAKDIRKISLDFDYSQEHTVLYGSSQGGFAALATGTYMPAARVVAECPQVYLRKYNGHADLNAMAKHCYGVPSIEDVPSRYNTKLSIIRMMRLRPNFARSLVLVKKSDRHHLCIHAQPLIKRMASNRLTLQICEDLGGAGHSALPKEFVIPILKKALRPVHDLGFFKRFIRRKIARLKSAVKTLRQRNFFGKGDSGTPPQE